MIFNIHKKDYEHQDSKRWTCGVISPLRTRTLADHAYIEYDPPYSSLSPGPTSPFPIQSFSPNEPLQSQPTQPIQSKSNSSNFHQPIRHPTSSRNSPLPSPSQVTIPHQVPRPSQASPIQNLSHPRQGRRRRRTCSDRSDIYASGTGTTLLT